MNKLFPVQRMIILMFILSVCSLGAQSSKNIFIKPADSLTKAGFISPVDSQG
ncbi:MAG: hypothetical protein IPG87_05975 [Saprospiraceae bacterium]|nr:hypothetical protein [Candidatus Vicinibacter affinis]